MDNAKRSMTALQSLLLAPDKPRGLSSCLLTMRVKTGSEFDCIAHRFQPTIKPMAKVKKFELESPAPILGEENKETLAAIDEGIRDAKDGRTVPSEEVRKRLPKWISGF
jgi:hypothetical protein